MTPQQATALTQQKKPNGGRGLRPESLIELFFHKLSQPIGALYGCLELGAMSEEPNEQKVALVNALDQIERLNWLFGVMRTFFGTDFADGAVELSLSSVLNSVVADMVPLAEDAQVALKADISGEFPVRANEHHLQSAIENLVGTAVRGSKAGSEVSVSTATEGQQVAIRVADCTPCTPEDLQIGLNPFPPGIPVAPGNAPRLDLALSRRILQAFGGELKLEASANSTRVLIATLPLSGQK
jgi:signal transduction histidine kinase